MATGTIGGTNLGKRYQCAGFVCLRVVERPMAVRVSWTGLFLWRPSSEYVMFQSKYAGVLHDRVQGPRSHASVN